ncbi:hypothetical protein [Vibrio ishigakensis]|uniref:hypothetical protein n=1 Tax=Vibrio ishigakensis TaxID=1481914 RepID=UPI0021C29D1A|nr:hypothetical protein [Vibrio ishigakensis]
MYGSEKTRAFCCNCKELTLHHFTMFSSQKTKSPRQMGLLERLFSAGNSGDYKCSRCGTYLHTPDHLD